MNFLNAAFLTLVSFSMVCSAWANDSGNDESRPKYKRVITTVNDRPDSPFNPVDPNHEQMLATGLYTQADADAIDAEAIQMFKDLYGIDFATGILDPSSGTRFLPGVAVMIPYIDGLEEDIVLITDTQNEERAESGKWFSLQVGVAVSFINLEEGTFTGGINAGAKYRAQDNWVIVYYNLLKKDSNWHKKRNREEFKAISYELGRITKSQWNQSEYVLSVDLTDKHGNVGTGSNGTVNVKRPLGTGQFFIRSSDTFTWDWE